MPNSLLPMHQLGAIEHDGTVQFGILLPWISARDGYRLTVRLIHERDQFLQHVRPVELPLPSARRHAATGSVGQLLRRTRPQHTPTGARPTRVTQTLRASTPRYQKHGALLFSRWDADAYTLIAVNVSDQDITVPFWFPISGDYTEELHGGALNLTRVRADEQRFLQLPANYRRSWTVHS